MFSNSLSAQISPGELTTAHKSLEGISNCTKCHILGEKVDNQKCLDCHNEINELINLNKGYHSSTEIKNEDCFKCHGEHFGRDFTLIRFNENKFDHSLTTFPLIGKHVNIKCEECHQSKFIQSSELKKKKSTFLGLENKCQSCHDDFHQGEFKDRECSSCHNSEMWRPALGFNHTETNFKLTGAHEIVNCEKCHKVSEVNVQTFQPFSIAKYDKCVDCHNDIHLGKFGTNCVECHTVQSFKTSKNKSKFDHSKTGYSLRGAHKKVDCNQCHTKSVSVKLKYQKCYNCHSDYHKGEFKRNGIQQDCSTCHTEEKFTPSNFTIENHSKTKFILLGSHLAVPCAQCHQKDSGWKFKIDQTNCITCHKNIHGELIQKYSDEQGFCEKCHNSNSWREISFDHNKTEFKLLGKHKSTECQNCHFLKNEQDFVFNKLENTCQACHQDNHNGQFEFSYSNNCLKCHTADNWTASSFNHDKTRFKLDGSHINVPCTKCHKSEFVDGVKIVNYKFEEITCKSCHS